MICPYNNFKQTNCKECGARMWVKDPSHGGAYLMQVCAIAYNGGAPRIVSNENKED